MSNTKFIDELDGIIADRLANPTQGSYTAGLAAAGAKRIAQKVGEEAIELAIASVAGNREETVNEAADLVYHLLVLLQMQDISIGDIDTVLENRHR